MFIDGNTVFITVTVGKRKAIMKEFALSVFQLCKESEAGFGFVLQTTFI